MAELQMLPCTDMDRLLKTAGSWDNILWGIKEDGVRCTVVVPGDGNVEYVSRNGKRFPNFVRFDGWMNLMAAEAVKLFGVEYPVKFDVEVVADGGRDFSKVMTQVRRLSDVDSSIFRMRMFDIQTTRYTQIQRLGIVQHLVMDFEPENVTFIEHRYLNAMQKSQDGIAALIKAVGEWGYEGIVLKTADGPYEWARSAHWCKGIPDKAPLDLKVIGMVEGTGKHAGMMGALICEYKGQQVKVGTGYSDDQRREFWADRPSLIEVSYREETKDGSLRFPAFNRVREDKDEASIG